MELEETTEIETPIPQAEGGTTETEVQVELQEEATTQEDKEKVGEDESAAATQDEGAHKPPKGVQKRLDELTKEKYEERREKEYWRDLAMKGLAKPEGSPETKPPDNAAMPTSDQYADYDEYMDAKMQWKVDQILKERETASKEQLNRANEEQAQKASKIEFAKNAESTRKKYTDFDDTIANAVDSPCTPAMYDAMTSSPNGPETMYYLAKNPAEARRIASMSSPAVQALEIGKLEAKLTAPIPKTEHRTITKTSEPIRTVSGMGVTERDPAKMNMEEYASWRMAHK